MILLYLLIWIATVFTEAILFDSITIASDNILGVMQILSNNECGVIPNI